MQGIVILTVSVYWRCMHVHRISLFS